MHVEQYVCTVCGFNMIGYYPRRCPFCHAPREKFLTSDECSKRFSVKGIKINEKVLRLNSTPRLGFEHAAYRITTPKKRYWIDCPSCFDKNLEPVDVIMFTHHHFLGASNQYKDLFASCIRIHKEDSVHEICKAFTFDELFEGNFSEDGIEAYHINGHTPGFTFYIFEDNLFICDYVFLHEDPIKFNPFGPQKETREGALKLSKIIENKDIKTVCGYNYVTNYLDWKQKFDMLLTET